MTHGPDADRRAVPHRGTVMVHPTEDRPMAEAKDRPTSPPGPRRATNGAPAQSGPTVAIARRLGPLERRLLGALPAISVTDIAERCETTRPSASRALHALANLDLVRSDADGNWRNAWRRTPKGDSVMGALAMDNVRAIVALLRERPAGLPAAAEAALIEAQTALEEVLA